MQRLVRAGASLRVPPLVACAQIHNEPINQPLVGWLTKSTELGGEVGTYYDDTVMALSFSGGGTRAAAFSYGVLTGFDETPATGRTRRRCSTASTSSPACRADRSWPPIMD